MTINRYQVRYGSQSGHCCFEATVVDTTRPEIIGGKQYVDHRGPHFYEVCECLVREDAERIADALNATGAE